jgi:cardiolipin synthase
MVKHRLRYDYAVSVEGPLVKEIHDSARRVWSRVAWSPLSSRPGPEQRQAFAFNRTPWAYAAAFLVRDNIRHRRDIEDAYLQAIEQAQFEIILANAYFFPG